MYSATGFATSSPDADCTGSCTAAGPGKRITTACSATADAVIADCKDGTSCGAVTARVTLAGVDPDTDLSSDAQKAAAVVALNTALAAAALAMDASTTAVVVVGRLVRLDNNLPIYTNADLAASYQARRLSSAHGRALTTTSLQVDFQATFATSAAAATFGAALPSSTSFTAALVTSLAAATPFASLTASSVAMTVQSAPAVPAPAASPAGLSTAGVIALAVVLGGGGLILILVGYFCLCRGKKQPAAGDGGEGDAPKGGLTVRTVGSPRSPKVTPA